MQYLPEVHLDGPPRHEAGRWSVPISIHHPSGSDEVPAVTAWVLVVEDRYPAGQVKFFPAMVGGLTLTFPHQSANDAGQRRTHRHGAPCLTHADRALGKFGGDVEPHTAYHRLHWHAERLNDWLHHARADTLLAPGDHYEHPDVRHRDTVQVAYHEATWQLAVWHGSTVRHGRLWLQRRSGAVVTLYPTQFEDAPEAVARPPWGPGVAGLDDAVSGVWIMAPSMPILPPWGYPRTWGELRSTLRQQGGWLDGVLASHAEWLRDGQAHVLLLGAPIPARMGGPMVRLYWQGMLLPELTRTKYAPGFRPNAAGRWRYDRGHVLNDSQPLRTMRSDNHHPDELGSRGLLPEDQRERRVVVIGAGALGAALAEHLARSGIAQLTLLDPEVLEHGNLVRHPLTMAEVGEPKAVAMARRLNACSPHMRVRGYPVAFPPHEEEVLHTVQAADVLIETTGSDDLIRQLANHRLPQRPAVISLSLGWQAHSLYAHGQRTERFDAAAFHAAIGPHVERDRPADDLMQAPREGLGCWHPVFPARYTDVQLLAATGMTFVSAFMTGMNPVETRVYEQSWDQGVWMGVRRREA